MKYIVILGDGMADVKDPRLDNKTCLEYANTANIDRLCKTGEAGLCKTVPDGMVPGSDVANMSVLGFDPKKYYTGRAPIEAVSMNIQMNGGDIALRCNLVTLSADEPYEEKTMLDYSAGEITTEEAAKLINYLKSELGENHKLYAGIQYRHCMISETDISDIKFTPPHDITGKPIENYLPKGINSDIYTGLMKKSYELLKNHPVNSERIKAGKRPADSIWLWGGGTKPALENFEKLHSLKGGIISAVDLIKGIGMLAGMEIIDVPRITGNYNTDFRGKAEAAVKALLNGLDFVYIHMEAPDECGHHGDYRHKVYSIEQIDSKVIKTITEKLDEAGEDYAILICPDHPTPCSIKTHTSDPVPYLIYSNKINLYNGANAYTEAECASTGTYVADGFKLIDRLLAIK